MPLIVSRANLTQDWDELITSYWTSWSSPLQAVGELTFAHLGEGNEAEATALADVKKSLRQAAESDPNIIWLKCYDTESGRIVAGGMYHIHHSNPYRAGAPRVEAKWFPEGSEMRLLAEEFYAQLWAWRGRLMGDRHVCGNALWALPKYRSRGATELIMDEFVRHMDALGMEGYLEATEMGFALYQRYGFVAIARPRMRFSEHKERSTQGRRLIHEVQAHPVWIMWRPAGGEYRDGETVLPWEGRAKRIKL
ncbi:hypothetical protein BDV35DRAFT_380545 [Aspergillus flavus]|uniref:N-acetyltransferase domain-containing protein n=2 Tax=Aspergillus subgen. Circumdati TaxID=2720871 RepID=A0A1S9D7E1_ASPOZ|nr:hypothetical protein BDV35DRAFT_380545 [Aspergillus flavus]OOO04990.1 hypothetical protein OAory_01113270 [Aspergillus oryzae]